MTTQQKPPEINETYIRKTPAAILLYLKQNQISYGKEIHHGIGGSYSHVYKTIKKLNEEGLIEEAETTEQWKTDYQLTTHGKDVAQAIENLLQVLPPAAAGENQ